MDTAATPSGAPAIDPSNTDAVANAVLDKLDAEEKAADPAPEAKDTQATEGAAQEDATAESQDESAQAEQPESPRYKVKVNGQEQEVPLDELLKGYSRLEDYKAKTAEVAEARRAAEAERQAVTAEKQRMSQQLGAVIAQARAFDPAIKEWSEIQDHHRAALDDPAGYVAKKAAFEQAQWRIHNYEVMQAQLVQDQRLERLRQEDARLREKIPEWGDDTKRSDLVKKFRETGKVYGFSEQELNDAFDHRALLLMRDAAAYRELQNAKQTAAAKKAPAPAPKPIKSSGDSEKQPDARLNQLRNRALKSGKDKDVLAFLNAAI